MEKVRAKNLIFIDNLISKLSGNHSHRTCEHQSSYNTADFTHEERQHHENTERRNEVQMNNFVDNQLVKTDQKPIEIMHCYNKSFRFDDKSEASTKENKMLKDALYATIKLVLDQNKQIKRLKEAVTDRNCDQKVTVKDNSIIFGKDESLINPDLSLMSISKDGINPITTVNNFLKEHMPTSKSSIKTNFSKFDFKNTSNNDIKSTTHEKEVSSLTQNEMDSINDVSYLLIKNFDILDNA